MIDMPRPSRRQLLAGSTALAIGATASVVLFGHRPLPERPSAWLGAALITLESAAEAILPPGGDPRGLAEGVDGFLAGSDPITGNQLWLALCALEHLSGPLSRFSRRSVQDRRAVLERWRDSPLGWRRQIFAAVRKVVVFSHYTNPASWAAIGYEGPWV